MLVLSKDSETEAELSDGIFTYSCYNWLPAKHIGFSNESAMAIDYIVTCNDLTKSLKPKNVIV